MKQNELISALSERLSGMPSEEIKDRLDFYSEMISDRIEEGLTEEEAVAAIGSVDEIAEQIIADIPLATIVKEKIKKSPKRCMKWWEITLLCVGSPIWLSLLISAVAVVISVYAFAWSVIISLWASFAAFAGCALGLTVGGVIFIIDGYALSGIAVIGAGIFFFGLAIFAFFGCKASTRIMLLLTKKLVFAIKKSFIKKEEAK